MESRMENENYIKEVRNQYESYPYPPRDPNDEKKELLFVPLDILNNINYHCFRARKTFITIADF